MKQCRLNKTLVLSCIFFCAHLFGYTQEIISEAQWKKGIEAFQEQDFETAIAYLKPFESCLEKLDKETSAELSYILANCYEQTGDLEKALSLYKIVLNSTSLEDNHIIRLLQPTLLSIYSELGDKEACYEYLSKMTNLLDDPSLKEEGLFLDYIISICTYYQTFSLYKKVIDFAQKGTDYINPKDNEEEITGIQKNTLYMLLGNAYYELGQHEQAVEYYKKAMHYAFYTDDCGQTRCNILSRIGICYELENLQDSAFIYLQEAEKFNAHSKTSIDQARETTIYNLASSFYNQASLNIKKGDYLQAEKNILRSLELLDHTKEKNKKLYILDQLLFSEILSKTSRIGKAISNLENLNSFVATVKGDDDTISEFRTVLTGLYASIGNYDKVLENDILTSEIQLKNKGSKSYEYAISLINLSEAYGLNQQEQKGRECLNLASKIIKKKCGKKSKEFHTVLRKQITHYTFNSTKTKVIEKKFRKCLRLAKKCFNDKSIEYGDDLCWYAIFKFYSTQDKKSITLMQKGLEILSTHKGYEENIPFYLHQLSTWYHFLKDYELAYYYDKQYFNKVKERLAANFPNLVDWQRDSLWTPIQRNLSGLILAATETNSPLYLKLAYNSILLGKGLLLQSSNNINNAIRQGEDSELTTLHNQIQFEKAKLLKATNQEDVDSIRDRINSFQRKELNKLASLDLFKGLFDIEWTDICDNLKEGDVAIEFISYPTQDCKTYVAFVINRQSQEPLCIPLFNDKELQKYVLDENVGYDYQNPELYRIIWNRLETYALHNAKRIYFSADGLLHRIAIENLIDKQGKTASDKWDLHRITSTRELVKNPTQNTYKTAVLYGGLKYTMDTKVLEDASSLRAGVKNLAETKVEIAGIKKILEEKSINCQIRTGEKGTEESFMSLSSTGINILHLATHGFFWTKENKQEYSNVQFLQMLNDKSYKESALLRSGLLLSGANVSLQGKNTSNNIEDGILTAQEIASLDFEGLDLVVLSACETALGEISGEGVFGLQRGFKLAGAKSILMSLWKVDDIATRMLMTEFYRHLLHGYSKLEALKKAQMHVRKQKGYEDPEYWAGFILLDGIN